MNTEEKNYDIIKLFSTCTLRSRLFKRKERNEHSILIIVRDWYPIDIYEISSKCFPQKRKFNTSSDDFTKKYVICAMTRRNCIG